MKFGNEDTFLLIGEVLNRGDEDLYAEFCKLLYKDTEMLVAHLCQNVQKSDKDDILQNVVCRVIKNLPRFYNQSVDKTVHERNAWLKTLVTNERNDYFRQLQKKKEEESMDSEDALMYVSDGDFEEKVLAREAFLKALKTAFEIPTSPDKLISFVYNRLLGTLSRTNGSPKKIVEELEDKTIFQAYGQMKRDLSVVLQYEIPEEIFSPLTEKVEICSDQLFLLSPRTITDSSNWIITKMKELKKNDE